MVAALGKGKNARVLCDGLARFAGWRIRVMNHGRLPKRLVIDLDSLPAEVHGRQPGSEWNGYYRARVYHPLVASVGETGDLLDVRLRRGAAHTAAGGLGFIVEVLDRAELFLCEKAMVRFDAGYPGEELMAVLKRLALPAVDALAWEALLAGRPYEGDEPRTWVCQAAEPYRAGSWSRTRRVVQVLVEEPGELFPRTFWLLTSLPARQVTGEELLAMYRQRGKAEGHMGELMSVVNPALSSSPRPKRHYRGQPVEKPGPGVDAFACNETRLLLAVFGYPIMHAQRAILERATGTGWSLRRLLERVLRAPARFTVSGRRITIDRERGLAALASPGPPAPAPARTCGVAFRDRRGSEGRGRRRRIRVPETGIILALLADRSPKTLAEPPLGPILGSGDPVSRPGEPDRPESSLAMASVNNPG